MLSSDVSAAFDPTYAASFDKKNVAYLGDMEWSSTNLPVPEENPVPTMRMRNTLACIRKIMDENAGGHFPDSRAW